MNLLIYVAGWSLIHFVWQGVAIAAAAAAVLRLVPASSARLRYAIASAALAAMLAAPAGTAGWLLLSPTPEALSSAGGAAPVAVDPAAVLPPGQSGGTMDAAASTLGNGPLLTTVVAVWVVGVLLCLGRLAGGWWRISRLHRAARSMDVSRWQATTLRLAASMRLRRIVRTVESELVDTPTVLGWLRPVILLPAAALANLSPTQLEAILAHELAHVRRHDYAINLLQTAAETLLFYHPAVWWVSRVIRNEREHCCDDVAVDVCGNPLEYAEALEKLETWRERPALAMSATGGRLLERVRRVLRVPADEHRPSASLGVISALVLLLIVVSGALQHLPARVHEPADPAQSTAVASQSAAPLPPGWRTVRTAHFDLAYAAELEPHVERVGREAEAAYAQLRMDLRHEPAFEPRLILFATRGDVERAVAQGFAAGGVPHIFVSLDTPPARLRGDLVHEVTHVFAQDIIPAEGRTDLPAWIHEGLADHERGEWEAADAAALRAMVQAGTFPRVSSTGGDGAGGDSRLSRIVGHAAFDFIVARAGKDGMRRFLLAVRQAPVGGVGSVYQLMFGLSADDFDRGVEDYVRAKFQQ